MRERQSFGGDEAASRRFVVSVNLLRRHLDTSQRAMIAGRLATLVHGGDRKSNQGAKSRLDPALIDQVAELVNVGSKAVGDARTVLAQASPETIAQVERGELSLSKAAKAAVT